MENSIKCSQLPVLMGSRFKLSLCADEPAGDCRWTCMCADEHAGGADEPAGSADEPARHLPSASCPQPVPCANTHLFSAARSAFSGLVVMRRVTLGPCAPTNEQLDERTGSWPLDAHLAQRRLQYVGHLSRLPGWAKHLLFAQPSTSNRAWGRPVWWDGAMSALADLGLETSWYHHAHCRSGSRSFVARFNPAAGWRSPMVWQISQKAVPYKGQSAVLLRLGLYSTERRRRFCRCGPRPYRQTRCPRRCYSTRKCARRLPLAKISSLAKGRGGSFETPGWSLRARVATRQSGAWIPPRVESPGATLGIPVLSRFRGTQPRRQAVSSRFCPHAF
eukprot:359245-Chlamydomonas_euryale.AAC.2